MTAKSSQTAKAAPPAPNGDVWDNKNISQKEPAVKQDFAVDSEAADVAYMEAVEAGDMETEQRMVDEAAKAAMPDSKAVDKDGNLLYMYHGTSRGGFTVFDTYASRYGLFGQGAYFTDNQDVANSYQMKGKGNNPATYKVFLNATNPLDMDAAANLTAWRKAFDGNGLDASALASAKTNEDAFRAFEQELTAEEVSENEAYEIVLNALTSIGYDSIAHIGGGRFNKNDGTRHRVFIVYEPEQIKSAETVTYDDKGNVIPLSERFKEKKSDIRFSKKSGSETTAYSERYGSELQTEGQTAIAMGEVPKGMKGKAVEIRKALKWAKEQSAGYVRRVSASA